jgi:hypothetical protein
MGYLILAGAIMLFSWLVSSRLKVNLNIILNTFAKRNVGAEIAEKMLADNGIRMYALFQRQGN